MIVMQHMMMVLGPSVTTLMGTLAQRRGEELISGPQACTLRQVTMFWEEVRTLTYPDPKERYRTSSLGMWTQASDGRGCRVTDRKRGAKTSTRHSLFSPSKWSWPKPPEELLCLQGNL